MKHFTLLFCLLSLTHATYAAEADQKQAATIVKVFSNKVDKASVPCRIGRAYYDDEPFPHGESYGILTLLQDSNDFTTTYRENRESIHVLKISVFIGFGRLETFRWVHKNMDHVFTPGSTEAIKLTLNLAEKDFSFEVVDDK